MTDQFDFPTCPVKTNDIVEIYHQYNNEFAKVVYIEMLPVSNSMIYTSSALASGASSNGHSMSTLLDMEGANNSPISEMGIYWMNVLSPVEVGVRQPASQGRFGTKNDNLTVSEDSGLIPIVVYQDQSVVLDFSNESGQTQTPKVQFFGYRCVLENIPTRQQAVSLSSGKPIETIVASGYR
jgi:hypothetical protein